MTSQNQSNITGNAIAVNATCHICYEHVASFTCRRCTYSICEQCNECYYNSIERREIIDQCGQCRLSQPWLRSIDPLNCANVINHINHIDDADNYSLYVDRRPVNNNGNMIDRLISLFQIISILIFCELLGFMFYSINGGYAKINNTFETKDPYVISFLCMALLITGILLLFILTVVCASICGCYACVKIALAGYE